MYVYTFVFQVVSELRLRVKSEVDDIPPVILLPHPLLPPPPVVITMTTTNHTFSVTDADTIMAVEVQSLSGLPEGAKLSEFRIRGDKSGIATLSG